MPGKAMTYKKEFEAITKKVHTMAMKTYKEAYKDADKSKYKTFADFEKAAKAYNTKKYGTTEPTKTAKEKGISKEELAKTKSDSKVKMDPIKAKPIAPVKPKAPKAKTTMQKAEDAIKAGDAKGAKQAIKDSDMKGKVKRKVKRVAAQEARKTKRASNKTDRINKKIDKLEGKKPENKAMASDKPSERKKLRKAKKLVKERSADGKVKNYAENAAVASDIALDTSPGSTYSKLLGSRAYKKNEADQRGKSVRQMKKESKEETVSNRYGGGETPAAYFKQKIKYNNSAKGIAIRVAADEKDKKNASKAGKKRLDKDISSMISHANMKDTMAMNYKTNTMRYDTNAKRYDSMAEKHHGGMPKMKTNQDGGGYAAKNMAAPGKQLKKLGSILSKHFKSNR